MLLIDRLTAYRAAVSLAQRLITTAHANDVNGIPIWPIDQRRLITEAAFLRIFIAWESFLEGAIADFMMSQVSIQGTVIPKFVSPQNHSHANKMMIGTQKYFDFSDPERVRQLCSLIFLNGEPFESTIMAINSDLRDLKTIRNAAAHMSSSTSSQLDAVASRKLTRIVVGTTVYDLLLAVNPHSPTNVTILNEYISQLDTAAYTIANC